MRRKSLTLTLSVVVIVVCLSLITMGTYALFSDTVSIEHHLQAGNLDVKLERTYLESKVLGTDGYLDTVTDSTVVDFTDTTNATANVFNLSGNELVAPGASYEATMKLTNEGTVAFGYWIEISLKDAQASDLAQQMKVVVTTYDENGAKVEEDEYLANSLSVGSETSYVGQLAVNTSAEFKVKIVFENLSINNDAQDDEVSFDLIVHAVQVLEK